MASLADRADHLGPLFAEIVPLIIATLGVFRADQIAALLVITGGGIVPFTAVAHPGASGMPLVAQRRAEYLSRLSTLLIPQYIATVGVLGTDHLAAGLDGAAGRAIGHATVPVARAGLAGAQIAARLLRGRDAKAVPADQAAVGVVRADTIAAIEMIARRSAVNRAAGPFPLHAGMGSLANRADFLSLLLAEIVPLIVTALGVLRAYHIAAHSVPAAGCGVPRAAITHGIITNGMSLTARCRTKRLRGRRAGLIPLHFAAVGILSANRLAAFLVGTTRSTIGLAAIAVARAGLAAQAAAQDKGVSGTVLVPLPVAAEWVLRADQVATELVFAARRVVGPTAVTGAGAGAPAGTRITEGLGQARALPIPIYIAAEPFHRANELATSIIITTGRAIGGTAVSRSGAGPGRAAAAARVKRAADIDIAGFDNRRCR